MMWQTILENGRSAFRTAACAVAVFALAGCASTISARVTSYQQWPADAAGATYRIATPDASPEQSGGTLEFQAFADMVRAAMGPTGLVEAAAAQDARFDVHLAWGSPVQQSWVQRYQDPFFDGWGFSPFYGGVYGSRWGWHSGIMMGPSVVNVPVQVHKNTLTVTIRDNANHGNQVYQSSAVIQSETDNLAAVMPYLAQAVFDDFPGNNGQVREVHYDTRR